MSRIMNATDKICRMLDERGVEYETDILPNGKCGVSWIDGNDIEWEVVQQGENFEIHALQLVTPEQAIAATVGRGNLTAEQVREAIMSADRWRKPMGDTGMTNTHLIIRDDGWQAIADELNATVGAGTIEKAAERIEVLSGFAREYLHRYGMLMSMAGEDVTDEVLAMENVINEVRGQKVASK